MSFEAVGYDVEATGVATITLDHPDDRNALSDQLLSELIEAFTAARDDASVRCVVLTSSQRDGPLQRRPRRQGAPDDRGRRPPPGDGGAGAQAARRAEASRRVIGPAPSGIHAVTWRPHRGGGR